MRNHKLLVLSACLFASRLLAQTPDDLVTQGRTYLVAHDLVSANTNFNAALALSPNHEAANALAAATRLLLLPQLPPGSNFLNRLGFTNSGRDIYNWTSDMPHDTNGSTIFPATFNTSEGIAFYRTNVMPALGASRTNLARIINPDFLLDLTAGETAIENVTVDYGDLLLLRAGLHAAEFLGYTLNAHNFNVVIRHLQDLGRTNGLTVQRVLADYPSLLTQATASDRTNSKFALSNAIVCYQAASAFIRETRPAGQVRLFNLGTNDITAEAEFRGNLTNVLASLNGPVHFNPQDTFAIDASQYFAGSKTLRSLVPSFNGNRYVANSLPDYTFGGILVDEPKCDTEAFLRQRLAPNYAGTFIGQDFWGDIYFSVFVGTNHQASMVGYDWMNDTGVFFEFKVEDDGSWFFATNGVWSSGQIHPDGSFEGEMSTIYGDPTQLSGSRQQDLGSFQGVAGYFSGTWTMTGRGSGKLAAVLSAEGQLYYCAFDSTAAAIDGGSGVLDASDHISAESVNWIELEGTLNRATRTIAGSLYDSFEEINGTFTLSRTASIPFDVPPTITSLPLSKIAPLGTNVTFSSVATGSPPLCFQWYLNDVAIPKATSASLVLSNIQWSSAGTYAVWVRNVAGGTNANATLTVVPETVKPTLAITNLTMWQRVSNAFFTVKGKAADNVGVDQVWCQLNSNGWFAATLTNGGRNWSADVILRPGTNRFEAYAQDAATNRSATTNVSFIFVASDKLAVTINGQGTVSPYTNGAWLEIGRRYTNTAKASSGSAFTNWLVFTNGLGGTPNTSSNLVFFMQSNLTLQATFVDVQKPTNTISSPTNGQRVNSAEFLVKGTAKDNVQVTNVWCQLNGGSWSNAVTANNWTNWSATVSLIPGTNSIKAYAVDAANYTSPTNSVSFFYVVTNRLAVITNGQGTVSPYTNGAWLEIGRRYTNTAKASSGCAFTNWLVFTNGVGGQPNTSSNLVFFMQSNLTLQATFVDVQKPTNTISSPTNGQRMSAAVFTVKGTARDNVQVTELRYQLNDGAWMNAWSTNCWTNWSATLPLIAGTNRVKAYAVDAAGNKSPTNSVSFSTTNAFELRLSPASAQPLAADGFGLRLEASPGLPGRIEVSTNLDNWTPLTSFVGTNVPMTYRDPAATNQPRRFYRAVTP